MKLYHIHRGILTFRASTCLERNNENMDQKRAIWMKFEDQGKIRKKRTRAAEITKARRGYEAVERIQIPIKRG